MWLGPAALRPYDPQRVHGWQGWRDFGLGSIGNYGAHTLDMAQWALGKDAESPVEVIPPDGRGAPLTLKYADGLLIYVPRITPVFDVVAFGTKGQKILYTYGPPPVEEKYDPTPLGPGEVRLYRTHNHHTNWLHCMRTRGKTICNEEVGFRSGVLCNLIDMADRLNRPLKFDPVRLEFPGDDEANRLLDTPKRAPWQVY
jgi:hypothetical protein